MADSRLVELQKIGSSTGGRNPIQEQEYQGLMSASPQGQAQTGIDSAIAANKTANDARFASNKSELGSFIDSYKSAVPGIISATSQKYQLPQLATAATNLGTRTSDIMGNLTGEGAGGYASGGQVDKAISTNYLPRWGQAVNNLNTATGLAQTEETQQIQPFTTQATLLNDRMTRESTGYSTQQQQELDSLVAKMNAGVALTQAEIGQATQLAVAEKNYQASIDAAKISANTLQHAPAGSTVFDPATGQYKKLS